MLTEMGCVYLMILNEKKKGIKCVCESFRILW